MSSKERLFRLEKHPSVGQRLPNESLLDQICRESEEEDRRNRLAFFYWLLQLSHRIDDPELPREIVAEAHTAFLRWSPYDLPITTDSGGLQLLAELNRQGVTALDVWNEFANGLPFPKFEQPAKPQPTVKPRVNGSSVIVSLEG
jgi:hypothetical protein